MVGSRVVGSNVVVAMHNYRGCACNVGHGNGNAQPSWMVGSKEVVVIHTHRGCTVMFIANHGRGNRIGNVGHRWVGGMQNISRSSSSSTSSPSNAIFAQDGHRPSNHCIKTATRPQAQLKTATGQRDDGHRPSNHGSRSWLGCRDCG